MNELEYLKKYIHPGEDLNKSIERLNNGEPVQYIVGDVDFYGNIIKVDKRVLIPRRETEELVEKTYNYINKYLNKNINILDLCTGSGCIAISLKKLLPDSKLTASDISTEALELAKENSSINETQVTFVESDLFDNITNTFDCIISNPPYISYDETIMDIVKNNEPNIALYADDNGLYFYKKILKEANKYLKEKFIIALEIGETQAQSIIQIAKTYFPNDLIIIEKDLQHLDRFVFIIRK